MTEKKPRGVLPWLVAVAFFMQTLDSTILNTALPAMAVGLGESPLRMQSVVVSYMLTVALLIPASGSLSDRFGTRRVFAAAMLLFTLGSLACALSTTLKHLVMARVLQGVGGSLLLPVGRLTILKAVPKAELLGVLAFVTVPGLVGPLMGPVLGGLLVERLSWHWIFLINLPVGLLGAAAAMIYMPDLRYTPGRFDWLGFVFVGVGMVSVSLGFEAIAEHARFVGKSVILLALGVASGTAYLLHAARLAEPLFNPALWTIHSYRVGLAGNLFARLGAGAMPFLTPLFLQVGLGYAPTTAGMFVGVIVLGAMASKVFVERLIRRFGYRRFLLKNTLLLGLMMMSFSLIDRETSPYQIGVHLLFFGVCNSFQFTAMNTLTLGDLEDKTASSGNSLLSMTMQLSMSLGVTAAATILSAFSQAAGGTVTAGLLASFHHTYLCVGVLASFSALIFLQLAPDDGSSAPTSHIPMAES